MSGTEQDRLHYRRSPILLPVANPVTAAWVPVQIAGLNVAFHVVVLIFANVFSNSISPAPFFVSLGVVHIILIFVCNREPHLWTIMQATGRAIRSTRNIVTKKKGIRLVP